MTAPVAIHLGDFNSSVAHRTVAVLSGIFPLLRTGAGPHALDGSLARFIEELNDATVLAIAPDVDAASTMLPRLHEAVTQRCRHLLRTIRQDVLPTSMDAGIRAIERRAAPRDPSADAASPLTRARRAAPDELMRLAAMSDMPEPLADILTSRVHVPAIVAALRNPSAAFNRSSLMMLAELAAGDRSLRDALIDYPKLPDSAADRLLPISGREATARLIMSGTAVSMDGEGGERLAPDPELSELAEMASSTLGIASAAAEIMLGARLDHACAVLLRAAGATESVLEAAVAMRDRLRLRQPASAASALATFRRFETEEARALTRLVDERFGPVAASLPAAA